MRYVILALCAMLVSGKMQTQNVTDIWDYVFGLSGILFLSLCLFVKIGRA